MQAKFRTSEGNWDVMEAPLILVHEAEDSFVLCAYADNQAIAMIGGVFDVMEFEVFREDSN